MQTKFWLDFVHPQKKHQTVVIYTYGHAITTENITRIKTKQHQEDNKLQFCLILIIIIILSLL
jgi:hypothetical protein